MDERLRALEAGAARGDPEARRALGWQRLRAGRVEPLRARLAAYLGDPAARQVVGDIEAPAALEAWVPSTLAVALDRTLAAVERWLAAPSHAAALAVEHAADAVPSAGAPAAVVVLAARHCCRPRTIQLIKELRAATGLTIRDAVDLLDRPGAFTGALALAAARATSEDAVRAAMRDALCPWALGGDRGPGTRVAPPSRARAVADDGPEEKGRR